MSSLRHPFRMHGPSGRGRKNEVDDDDSGSNQPDVQPHREKGPSLRNMFRKKADTTKQSEDGVAVVTTQTHSRAESPPPVFDNVDSLKEEIVVTPTTQKTFLDRSDPHCSPTFSSDVSVELTTEPAIPTLQHKAVNVTPEKEPNAAVEKHLSTAACYLVYEPDSSGRLVEHYSMKPVDGAVGRWVPGGGKKIANFKMTRNAGRNVLIGNCSAGVQGRKNYCNGWCQFVKSAKIMNGTVQLWDPTGKGMMVDVYLYYDDKRTTHQTIRLEQGVPYSTDRLMAVACIPKSTTFFEGMTVDLLKWLSDARDHGYSTEI